MGKLFGFCRWAILGIVVIWMLASAGCTRVFFRKQADREVDQILREKEVSPLTKIENMHVYPDMRARFADPSNPDHPPMPPDDPLAKWLGPNPQKPRHDGIGNFEGTGYLDVMAQWDAENRARRAAMDQQMAAAPRVRDAQQIRQAAHSQPEKPVELPPPNANGKPKPYIINMEQAIELGLMNSREFQTRREDLYLAALPVTRERFSFSAQYFAAGQAVRERTGLADPDKLNDWRGSSAIGFSKLFSTGALLLVGLANQTVINFGNPAFPHVTSQSNLNVDFLQPLLRGGGRAVTLEPLTLAERSLLYEVRNYVRFRKQYYQYLTGGSDLPAPPGAITTIGALASSHLLLPNSSNANPARQQVTPSGLGAVGGSATTGSLFLGINPTAPSEGYMQSLYKVFQLKYEEDNVKALSDVLPLFEEYERGGLVSFLQVGQVQLQLLQGRSTVLANEQILQTSLDAFRTQLGLPMYIPIQLDDEPIRAVTDQLTRYYGIIEDYKATIKQLDRLDDEAKPEKLRGSLHDLVKSSPLTRSAKNLQAFFGKQWAHWEKLKDAKSYNDYMIGLKNRQRKMLDLKTDLELKGMNLSPEQQKELKGIDSDIAIGILEDVMRSYEKAPWRKEVRADVRLKEKAARWRDVRNAFAIVLGDASEERFIMVREAWMRPPPVIVNGVDILNVDINTAYDITMATAVENRLELMNARGQLMDAWRQVRVFANSLLGVFNVQYHMDSATPPNQATPLAFENRNTRHQMVFNFELPLVRITERNGYRASLIAYQRTRRDLQQKEDEIAAAVRADVRQLKVLLGNLTIQQQAVELAFKTLESSYEVFTAPQVPDNSPNAAAQAAANAATLTNQLLQAYARLPQAQEQLAKTWIDYQVARQQLFLDLELMPLDARGVWIDEFANNAPGQRINQHLQRPVDANVIPATRGPAGRLP